MLTRALVFVALLVAVPASAELTVSLDASPMPLHGREVGFTLTVRDDLAQPVANELFVLRPEGRWEQNGAPVQTLQLRSDDEGQIAVDPVRILEGGGWFQLERDERGGSGARVRLRSMAPFWTLVPPLLAILLALTLRQVLLALFAGVLGGAWILLGGLGPAFLMSLDLIVKALTDTFQGTILLFTAILGGMVGVMARTGGTHGIVDLARRGIRGPRSAQVMTALMGLLIFFDDYANTLLVGNTMRPVTDRMKLSREKLSFLVDSTAAPVTTIAIFSTWVGYQMGLIGAGLESIGRSAGDAYSLFRSSIPYSTYSWLALALVFWVAILRRDYGPMLAAERRASRGDGVLAPGARPLADDVGKDLAPSDDAPRRASHAILPLLVTILGTAFGLYFDGMRALRASRGTAGMDGVGLRDVLNSADPANALLWAVVAGSMVAIGLAIASRTLDIQTAMESWMSGAKAMIPALVILLLAWAIGDVCEALGTAPVVVDWATGNLSARLVPTVTFLVAAFLGFSTGTSWGTMAILMPIVIPLASQLPEAAGLSAAAANSILLSSVACVLSGSVFGDHCSPISDTTIMSSMASGADHVDHVRTQFPYAALAGTLAVVAGTVPAGFGVSPWIGLVVGAIVIGTVIRIFGRVAEDPA